MNIELSAEEISIIITGLEAVSYQTRQRQATADALTERLTVEFQAEDLRLMDDPCNCKPTCQTCTRVATTCSCTNCKL